MDVKHNNQPDRKMGLLFVLALGGIIYLAMSLYGEREAAGMLEEKQETDVALSVQEAPAEIESIKAALEDLQEKVSTASSPEDVKEEAKALEQTGRQFFDWHQRLLHHLPAAEDERKFTTRYTSADPEITVTKTQRNYHNKAIGATLTLRQAGLKYLNDEAWVYYKDPDGLTTYLDAKLDALAHYNELFSVDQPMSFEVIEERLAQALRELKEAGETE
ncbi:hypothetical protein B0H94_11135 [Salsuginibacillus halophilus]|uniref:Uncharacterized protein n=1 Tax=Salsuginibacillus halophilus TaxID=517424 RepID=A0A2P8HAG2_9BACI|nr:hypothetical protein [Salsuginibacillus halophilus]PSL43212.1 hypothetical protein B0H94_11135 [Salsuginibacillus halophilus]